MKKLLGQVILGASYCAAVLAGSTEEWKQRTVYQVITDRFAKNNGDSSGCGDFHTYCGGTWKGIANNLDYIQGMGFDAIWISPVVKNLDGGYHGYWATNWEEVNENFGSKSDLKQLVDAAHARGIWVMVDVVANHVGPVGMDFSQIYPLNKSEHYHNNCQIQDWSNQQQVENCRLADLPDLAQENSYVRQYLKDWIKNLVQTYGFDGIRIDTIPEVPKDFWSEYTQAAGVYAVGECFNGDPNYVGDYQNHVPGLLNYPMYFTIRDIWQSGQSMYNIRSRYAQEASTFRDIDALGVFVDNHDNARFLNGNSNTQRFKNALVFSVTSRGVPIVYYGSEQNYAGGSDPGNREPLWTDMDAGSDQYKFVSALVNARKAHKIWNEQYIERYVDDNFYAFSRGNFLVALTNVDSQVQRTVSYQPFGKGVTVCNVFYTNDCITVDGNGALSITLINGEAKIFVARSTMSSQESDNDSDTEIVIIHEEAASLIQ